MKYKSLFSIIAIVFVGVSLFYINKAEIAQAQSTTVCTVTVSAGVSGGGGAPGGPYSVNYGYSVSISNTGGSSPCSASLSKDRSTSFGDSGPYSAPAGGTAGGGPSGWESNASLPFSVSGGVSVTCPAGTTLSAPQGSTASCSANLTDSTTVGSCTSSRTVTCQSSGGNGNNNGNNGNNTGNNSSANPVGALDSLTCSVASGWSFDPTYNPTPQNPVIYGCTNPSATNYNSSATNDDGSCTFPPPPTTPTNPTPPPSSCTPRYRWVNSSSQNGPAAACASVGAVSVASSPAGICASGENRPTSGYGYSSIYYSNGTWGSGNGGGGDFVRNSGPSAGGYYCYKNSIGQVRDEDITDRAVAYYCDFGSSYPESCPSGNQNNGGGGGGCFTAETMISLSNGTYKKVSELKVGDVVKGESRDNNVMAVALVELGDRPLYSISTQLNSDQSKFVTAGHPFKTTEGWKSIDPQETAKEGVDLHVEKLEVGDYLITENGTEKVVSISSERGDSSKVLYNPMLDGDNTYYANGFLVHNKQMIGENPYGENTDVSNPWYLNSNDLQPTKSDLLASIKTFIDKIIKPFDVFAASGDSNTVLVYEGSNLIATIPANIYRPDVNAVFGITGNHGFSWTVPESLKNGTPRTLRFYGTNTDGYGSNTEISGSPRTITCAPTVVPNSAPSSPSLSCPANGSFTNTSLDVGMTSSDSNGDGLRYHIDWDNNGVVDQIIPSGGVFAPSGVQQIASRSWSTPGNKTVSVMAQDSQGAFSSSASCSFNLVDQPPVNPPTDPSGDQCLNIPQLQTSVPTGFTRDVSGNCSPDNPLDWCQNIVGNQSSLPANHTVNSNGDCVAIGNPPGDNGNDGGNGNGGGGNGGNGNGNNGNGSGSSSDYSVSGDSKIGIQFLADLPSTSQVANLSVNPVSGYASPVTLSVQSIKSVGGADLAGVTATYFFDGQESPTALMTYDGSTGMYRNPSGLIGTKFAVRLSKKITEKYYITIVGTSGSMTATHVIELDPSAKSPVFQEI